MTSGNVLHGIVIIQIGLSEKINKKKKNKKNKRKEINRAGTIECIGC